MFDRPTKPTELLLRTSSTRVTEKVGLLLNQGNNDWGIDGGNAGSKEAKRGTLHLSKTLNRVRQLFTCSAGQN